MVFGTIMPAFAESTDSQAGQDLESYGIIAGNGTGLNESGTLTRAEMTVILAKLNGKATEAAAYAFESAFTDDADAWYTPWVAYAATQGWMSGYPDGTFKPSNVISAQEVNVLMVKALGYDVEWATANATAADLGVAVTAKDAAKVLRGEIFTTLRAALDVNAKDATDTLGTALALTGYVSPTPATPETLAVSKVMTDNRKTVVIEFNQELFKKSVNTTNFKVSGLTVSKALLSEDMKTVTLVMGSQIAQSKEIEVVIEDVKTADEKLTIADYKEKFIVNDVTIPVVESITVIDAKHVKIQATEPMNFENGAFTVLSGIKIDGNAVIGKVVADHQAFTYTIELNSAKKEGSYKMVIDGLKDFSDLAAVKKEFSFDVVKDDTAPVALSAKATSVTTVEVTFDEPLSSIGSMTVNGKSTTLTYKADTNQKVVIATLELADKLTLGATVEVNVKYKGQKDVVSNEVKTETTLTFKVEDDTALPTVSVEVKAGNKMVLTFSKAMDITLGKVIVLDKDKKAKREIPVLGLGSWNTEKTVLTITADSISTTEYNLANTNPMESYLQIKDMKDSTVRANLLATTDLSVSLLDTQSPTVSDLYVTKAGTNTTTIGKDDTLTFFFSEAMDEDTLKNLSNYLVSGTSPLSAVSGVSVKSVASDMKSVVITYPMGRNLTTAITVIALKDTAGNMSTLKVVTGNSAGASLTAYTAKATKTSQVVVTFTGVDIKSIDPSALAIYKGTDAYTTVSSIESVVGNVVTLNLVKAIGTDAVAYNVKVISPTLITTTYGTKFTYVSPATSYKQDVVDAIAPTIAKIEDGFWNGTAVVTRKNSAVITMSETVVGNIAPTDVVVKLNDKLLGTSDYKVENLLDGKYYNVTVYPNNVVETNGKYSLEVQLVRESTTVTDDAAAPKVKLGAVSKSISDLDYSKAVAVVVPADAKTTQTVDATKTMLKTIDIKFDQNIAFDGTPTLDATFFTTLTVADGVGAAADLTADALVVSIVDNNVLRITTDETTVGTGEVIVDIADAKLVDAATGQKLVIASATLTDRVAPAAVSSVTIGATSASVTFSEAVVITTPAVGRFAANAGNVADITTAPTGSTTAVIVSTYTGATFATGVASVMDYTALTAGNAANLKDAAGNEVADFTDLVVTSGF